MRRLLAILVAVVLAGCQTTDNYEFYLDSWVGRTETDVIRVWGVPTQAFDSGGHRFLQYGSRANVTMPGAPATSTTTFIGNQAFTTTTGGSPINITLTCTTTFDLVDGRVVSWTYRGNNCVARPREASEYCDTRSDCLAAAEVCLGRGGNFAAFVQCMAAAGFNRQV